LEATLKGYEEEFKSSSEMMKKYNQGYNSVSVMKEYYEQERNQLGRDRQRYQQLKTAYETQISAIKLVQNANIPIIKSRPKRSIIVLSATLLAFSLCLVGALLVDNYRDVNWQAITSGK
jgi:LPS O-antigen subunit length determinant protein (WzzB/FepE family)